MHRKSVEHRKTYSTIIQPDVFSKFCFTWKQFKYSVFCCRFFFPSFHRSRFASPGRAGSCPGGAAPQVRWWTWDALIPHPARGNCCDSRLGARWWGRGGHGARCKTELQRSQETRIRRQVGSEQKRLRVWSSPPTSRLSRRSSPWSALKRRADVR